MGSATSLRIRGEEGFRTLTLFDGIRLSDPSGPQVQPQLQHVVSSGIQRVEVLRGPQGLSFGADAGGVIAITSKQGEGPLAGSVDGHAGSFGTNQLAFNLGAGTERADFYVSASSLETEGFNARVSDTNPGDKDGYDNETFHGRVGFNLSEQWRLDLVHRNSEGDTEFDGCTFTINDCNSLYELEASRVQLKYSGAAMTHSVAVAQTESDNDSLTQGVSAFTAIGKLERVEYIGQLTELNGFDLVFGVDLEEESNNAISRDNIGYYGEFLSDFSETLFFTAGVRVDDNDDFGQHTSFRVSTAHLIDLGNNNTLKLKASAGSGFRAPSTAEIAYNAGPFASPPASNVRLSEETSQGFELGLEYFVGTQLKLEAVYFDQDVEDAILFDLDTFSGYLQDVGNSNSSGIELVADYALSANWALKGNYTFNETERPNGLQRIRRPEHLANLGVSYRSSDNKLSFNAFYRSSANAVDGNTVVVPLDDFGVVDINARYQINQNVEFYARVENALDEDYQEINDFNSPQRGSYIGARLSF
jgi:vitamin B12 transporter